MKIEDRMNEYCSMISYDIIASDDAWDKLGIIEDIITISNHLQRIRSKKDNSTLWNQFSESYPLFLFLIRDRMLHKTITIPTLLPLMISSLQIVSIVSSISLNYKEI
jgi:hypothetical protein